MREEKMSGLGRSLARAWTRAALVVAFTLVLISSLASTSWARARFKTLHTFTQTGANSPRAGLVADLHGNLYGTTYSGGAHNRGTVFELAPDEHGGWKRTVLHSFNFTDGDAPSAALIFDSAGNLYGTTSRGGNPGFGTVFELAPDGHGGWKETVLHSFNSWNGYTPLAVLIFDSAGNLYGTTVGGGANNAGIVFELAPDGHGGWNETVLHRFNPFNGDGYAPFSGLIFDSAGNLYGTTAGGGTQGFGTVFELAPDGHGGWNETVLHSFDSQDGEAPIAGLIFDAAGNLYGTTERGGAQGMGTAFELSPDGHGDWKETVLHSFNILPDAQNPATGLIFDAAGNLYGATELGGAQDLGAVFRLAPDGRGGWKETVLHSFKDRPGASPLGSLIFGRQGHLYGTTLGYFEKTWGSVFEIAP